MNPILDAKKYVLIIRNLKMLRCFIAEKKLGMGCWILSQHCFHETFCCMCGPKRLEAGCYDILRTPKRLALELQECSLSSLPLIIHEMKPTCHCSESDL